MSKQHIVRTSEKGVFINCPFDVKFVSILQAIIFAVHDAGFVAHSALDDANAGKIRLTKILQLIRQCPYSIHDLSRAETGRGKLPRFNMPFELGLFMGCQAFGGKAHQDKQALILDGKPFHSKKTLSDIAGLDALPHYNDQEEVIRLVRTWLRNVSHDPSIPGGDAMIQRYRRFKRALPSILKSHRISVTEIKQLEFHRDYCDFVVAWLKRN